ncbi:MAG: ABC transporter ATP-binding protein [Phycisphaerales bacterium]
MIRIEQVTKRFGRTKAVDGVSLDLASGGSYALWGANGAGKTTLIRCVLGLIRFRGRIVLGGHDVTKDGKRARMLVGYVPQELGFYDDLRVAEAVRFFGRLKGVRVSSTRETLEGVGLGGHEGKRVRELSGGMKQRLALATALLGDPPVLVLDEVTASLDAYGRKEFVRMLAGLTGKGRTMLFASHRVEEVLTLAGRVITMEKGRVTGEGEPERMLGGERDGTVLHLVMSEGVRTRAIELLRANGYAARLNGVGLLVPVPAESKAAPVRILAEASITVDDLNVLTGRQAQHRAMPPEVN